MRLLTLLDSNFSASLFFSLDLLGPAPEKEKRERELEGSRREIRGRDRREINERDKGEKNKRER